MQIQKERDSFRTPLFFFFPLLTTGWEFLSLPQLQTRSKMFDVAILATYSSILAEQ